MQSYCCSPITHVCRSIERIVPAVWAEHSNFIGLPDRSWIPPHTTVLHTFVVLARKRKTFVAWTSVQKLAATLLLVPFPIFPIFRIGQRRHLDDLCELKCSGKVRWTRTMKVLCHVRVVCAWSGDHLCIKYHRVWNFSHSWIERKLGSIRLHSRTIPVIDHYLLLYSSRHYSSPSLWRTSCMLYHRLVVTSGLITYWTIHHFPHYLTECIVKERQQIFHEEIVIRRVRCVLMTCMRNEGEQFALIPQSSHTNQIFGELSWDVPCLHFQRAILIAKKPTGFSRRDYFIHVGIGHHEGIQF